jgi:hypothetical protein
MLDEKTPYCKEVENIQMYRWRAENRVIAS